MLSAGVAHACNLFQGDVAYRISNKLTLYLTPENVLQQILFTTDAYEYISSQLDVGEWSECTEYSIGEAEGQTANRLGLGPFFVLCLLYILSLICF